jgi:hypothetical protein
MQRPAGFVHVPGNHDLYLPSALREQRFVRAFAGTLATDLPELAGDDGWPIVRLFGEGIAVVAVNSARPNPEPWRSSGFIPPAQLAALERALAAPPVRGRFVFVITHYAPRRGDGRPDGRFHGLDNADAFLDACRGVERGAILHGHIHSSYRLDLPGLPAIFCAGSSTHEGREGLWIFDVDDRGTRSATARRGRFDGTRYVVDGAGAAV